MFTKTTQRGKGEITWQNGEIRQQKIEGSTPILESLFGKIGTM